MNILTGKSLPRRTLLKGLGASLALPLLDSMFPAFGLRGQSAPERVHRFQTFYVPNGMAMARQGFTGAATGAPPVRFFARLAGIKLVQLDG